ncbi:MAG TPA: hypothetical protein VGK67_10100 [Myxococcales bacterium]
MGIAIDDTQSLTGTFRLDGTTWTDVTPSGDAPGRYSSPVGMAWNPVRGRLVVQSDALWEWDGQTWTQRAATPTGLAASLTQSLVCDAKGRVLDFGEAGTWTTSKDSVRAGIVGRFPIDKAWKPTAAVQEVDLLAAGGGGISTGAATLPGATLAGWSYASGGWQSLAANTSPDAAPSVLHFQTGSALDAARLVDPLSQSIEVGLFPLQGPGTASSVSMDHLELTVRYLAP